MSILDMALLSLHTVRRQKTFSKPARLLDKGLVVEDHISLGLLEDSIPGPAYFGHPGLCWRLLPGPYAGLCWIVSEQP